MNLDEHTPQAIKAALETALWLHRPQDKPVTSYTPCQAHAMDVKHPLLPDIKAMRDCPDCQKFKYQICDHCECPNDKWPCPTYQVIEARLEDFRHEP